jgi:hypothetical protein
VIGGIHLTGLTQVSGSPWSSRSRVVHARRMPPVFQAPWVALSSAEG